MQVENKFYSSISINKKEQKQKGSCRTYKYKKKNNILQKFLILNKCTMYVKQYKEGETPILSRKHAACVFKKEMECKIKIIFSFKNRHDASLKLIGAMFTIYIYICHTGQLHNMNMIVVSLWAPEIGL